MPSNKLENYEILETIGSGSYGICKKVRRKTDNKVLVWKELNYGSMTECEKQLLVSEVNLLRELKHPNIVQYYDRIIDRSVTTIYLVMEYCEGGDLSQLIARCKKERKYLESAFIWKLLSQLVSALHECHKRENGQHILHRDLKPANIFLDVNNNVKLGDFGLARVLSHDCSMAQTFVGTPYYMSPEQMNKTGYNDKSDVWSLGCLLYEACALAPPFLATNQNALAQKIKIGQFHPIPLHYPKSLSHLITTMLRVDDDLRPSVYELAQNPILKRKNLERLTSPTSQLSNIGSPDILLQEREKALDDRERELQRREESLREREKVLEEKLSRTELLLNELQLKRQDQKSYQVASHKYYEKENKQAVSRKCLPSDRPFSNKIYGTENNHLTNVLAKAGFKSTAAVLASRIPNIKLNDVHVKNTSRKPIYMR